MVENYTSSLAAYFYTIELWFTSIYARGSILIFLVLNLVLCSTAAIAFLKRSAKVRDPWHRPSTYPMSIPIIGHLLMMAWDSYEFMSAVTSVSPYHTDDLLDLC